MKQKNKLRDTILIIFLMVTFVSMFKYFHFMKLPSSIQGNYQSFVSYPGVGGVLSILTITLAAFLIFNIWRKSKEEKLLKSGSLREVENIKKLFSEGLLTEKEVDAKFDILLKNHQVEINKNQQIKESLKKTETIKNLSDLRDKGLLTDEEYELKKELVQSSNKSNLI